MNKKYLWPGVLFALCFVLGSALFFPVDKLRGTINDIASKSAGVNIQIGQLQIGTGLGLGVMRGGLLALHGHNVTIWRNGGGSFRCSELSLSPQLWTLFLGRVQLAFACKIPALENGKDAMSLTGAMDASPFWAPQHSNLNAEFKDLDVGALREMVPALAGASGVLNGSVELKDLNASRGGLPQVAWELKGQGVVLPPLASDFLNVPALDLGPLQTKGALSEGKLHVQQLQFGTDSSALSGNMRADLGLNPMGQPVSGDISGKIKTDPVFETTQLKDIKLDLIFGKVDPSGSREFKKVANSNPLALFMSPPVE